MKVYKLTEINGCHISIGPCPKGNEDLEKDIQELSGYGISMIVSLITYTESVQLALSTEADVCKSHSIEFMNFPIMDKGICGFGQFVDFIELLYGRTQELNSILIHCQHGIGRSGMIALGLMLRDGKDLEESIMQVSAVRGYDVPQSLAQRRLLGAYHKFLSAKA